MELAQRLGKHYAELLTYAKALEKAYEEDMRAQIEFGANVLHRWNSSDEENQALKSLIRNYEKDVATVREHYRESKAELLEARSQIAALVSTNQSLMSDKHLLEEQVNAVRSILTEECDLLPERSRKRLEFLTEKSSSNTERASGVSETGIDFDHTDDSSDDRPPVQPINLNGGDVTPKVARKRSNSVGIEGRSIFSPKRSNLDKRFKGSKDDLDLKTTNEPNKQQANEGVLTVQPSCLLTASSGSEHSSPYSKAVFRGQEHPRRARTSQDRKSRSSRANPEEEAHVLLENGSTFGNVRRLREKGQLRQSAASVLGYDIEKRESPACKVASSECRTQLHQECRNNAVQPCVPRTPNSKNPKGKLLDYVPTTEPYVPHIVVHLVGEIERRGLDYVGLYRVPGTDSKVKDLLERFLFGRGVPNVKLVDDISVLTGCLKKFFQQLKEPLIPYTSRGEFFRAAVEESDLGLQMKKVHQAITELPLPSRDTLAFLVLHLQKVSAQSSTNKMPICNLARIFGPTILGGNCDTMSVPEIMDEAAKQEKVMAVLLSLPRQYWMQYVNISETVPLVADRSVAGGGTPGYRSVINSNTSTWSIRNASRLRTPTPHGKSYALVPWR